MHGQYLEQQGFNETSRILCTRTLQTSRSPWPCHCCCAFQQGMRGGIFPPFSPRCKPRDKTPRKYLGFGSRALSPTWYERESSSMMPRTMAPWSIDESFPIPLFEDNRDPTSVMYQQFIQSSLFYLTLPPLLQNFLSSRISSRMRGARDREIQSCRW